MNVVLAWVAAFALVSVGWCDKSVSLIDLGLENVWLCDADAQDESHTGGCVSRRGMPDWCPNPKQEYDCNCGCGTYDPDCSLPLRFRPKLDNVKANMRITCSPGGSVADGRYTFCQQSSASCVSAPLDWTCEPRYYDEATLNTVDTDDSPNCHCECGVWDPDCDNQGQEGIAVLCNVANGEYEGWQVAHPDQVCTTERTCMAVPEAWTCPTTWYNELSSGLRRKGLRQAVCDCGCGVEDPDCEYEHKRSTEGLEFFGLSCNGSTTLETSLNRYCDLSTLTCADAPEGWECPARYYGEAASGSVGPNGIADCHCGCGSVMDPDCELGVARRNGKAGLLCKGANSDESAPSPADMDLNNYCVYNSSSDETECTSAPPGWSPRCVASFYDQIGQGAEASDSRCDCACGIWDPDCNNLASTLFCSPDQSSSAPSSNEDQWCSQKTLQCVSTASVDPVYNGSALVTQFNEVEYGPALGRSKPNCDCGVFTEFDPDCYLQVESELEQITTSCPDHSFCDMETNVCVPVPEEWTCAPVLYNQLEYKNYGELLEPTCDCGCGVWDPDCNSQVRKYSLTDNQPFNLNCWDDDSLSGLRTSFCQNDTNTCGQAPGAWYGAPEWFNETRHGTLDSGIIICHCGLGLYDPDCDLDDLNVTWCGTTPSSKKCDPDCPNCVETTVLSSASTLSSTLILFFCSLLAIVVM